MKLLGAIIIVYGLWKLISVAFRAEKHIEMPLEARFLMRDRNKYPFTASADEVERLVAEGNTYHGPFGGGLWYNNQWIPKGFDISVRPDSNGGSGVPGGGEGG